MSTDSQRRGWALAVGSWSRRIACRPGFPAHPASSLPAQHRRRESLLVDHYCDVQCPSSTALADVAGAVRVHVVGHDWGGAVAWALAGWHPDRLFSMTSPATPHPRALLRSFGTSSQALYSWYMALYQLPRFPEMGINGPFERRFRQTLSHSGLPDDRLDQYLSVLQEPRAATAAINWYRAMPLTAPSRMVPVALPALYLYGTEDFALGRNSADLSRRYVNGPYDYKVIEGASHWLPEARPDVVAREVIAHAGAFGGVR